MSNIKAMGKHGGRDMLYKNPGSIPTALPKRFLTAFRYARTVADTERRGRKATRQKCPANSYDVKITLTIIFDGRRSAWRGAKRKLS